VCGAGCYIWATKWAALTLGRSKEEKGGKRESRPRGRGEKWAEPETGRGRGNLFPFSKFMFCSNLLKRICKTNLN